MFVDIDNIIECFMRGKSLQGRSTHQCP